MNFFRKKTSILFFIGILFFAIAYSALSLLRHSHFQSGGFDLGIYDQSVWQYSNFLYPFSSIKEKLVLGDHLALTLPLISPLYWIWDDVRTLLVFQALWISFSSVAIFLYLLKRNFSQMQSLILSFLYLSFYGIQYGVYFDFHPSSIGLGLLAWVLYFWESERWKIFIPTVALLLLTQENMGVALFGLCAIWFFQKKHLRFVFILTIVSIAYTVFSIYIISLISPGGYEYKAQMSTTFSHFANELFNDAQKRQVWFYSFGWFSFLPLFSPGALMATIIDNAQYFATGDQFNRMWSPFTHHRLILSIYLLVGVADVLSWFKKIKKINITIVVIIMLAIALIFQYKFHFPLNKLSKSEFWLIESWVKDNRLLLSKIPKDASVAAQQSLVPHLSHRRHIYLVYPRKKAFTKNVCSEKECWWLDFGGEPEYLAVDTHDGIWLTMLLEESDNFKQGLANMENNKVVQLIYRHGHSKLYKVNRDALGKIK
ncbi:MAG: DUF2079 domain-containing protein [Candidatus Levybacteria bacterium]|nr:DUF2079 domain-containing protein [Candidatus Levybacteria bacterium]MDZ4228170.1 DUF2079 domain-containing protein [Candidatus Levybacteria bacterium]